MTRLEPDQPMKALAWMACSALGFSTMAIFVKQLGTSIPEFQLVFFRSFLNLIFVLGMMIFRRESLFPEPLRFWKGDQKRAKKLHLLLCFRGLTGFAGISCLFYSIHHLPLPIAMMLGWCSPLFVILFSRWFLSERLPQVAFFSILCAFVGLFFLLNPLGWGGSIQSLSMGAVLLGLFGAAMSGAAYVAVRAATARVGPHLIVVYFMGVATLISAPLAAWQFRMLSWGEAAAVLGIGVAAAVGQVAMTHGYRYAPASRVSTMSLLNAGFSAFFGWWLFDERLSGFQWIGMLTLATGIAILTWSTAPRRTGRPSPSP